MGKAIVLTSDTVPAEIPGLEERLRSRFAMGLITDIQEPNYETRVAILQKKAEAEGLRAAGPGGHFIARHVQKNVRELEGALVKMSAVHSLTGQAGDGGVRRPGAEGHPARAAARWTSTQIQREVARYFKVAVEALRRGPRTRRWPTRARWPCT